VKKNRNYGIDLLRLVLMFMVCTLHVLGQGGILDASIVGSTGYLIFWFLEIFSYCAVDAFAIISGYTAQNKQRQYDKIVNMWFQVFFYSFIVTIMFYFVGVHKELSLVELLKCAFPITFGKFWYMSAYFALFFAIPVLNNFIFNIDKETAKKAFLILFILFSVIGILGDAFDTLNGYSAIWLMILYCLGGLAKRIDLFENKKSLTLIIFWGICIIGTWVLYIGFGIRTLINYISPTILMSGLLMVILFSRLKLKGKIISKLSPLALGVYLFQLSPVIWNVLIKGKFSFVAGGNAFTGTLMVFILSCIIFISGLVIEFMRSRLADVIKLPLLSKKIENIADNVLNKLSIVLK